MAKDILYGEEARKALEKKKTSNMPSIQISYLIDPCLRFWVEVYCFS